MSNSWTTLSWNRGLILQWLDKSRYKFSGHFIVWNNAFSMCLTNLIEYPSNCIPHLEGRVYEHSHKLIKTWNNDLSKFSLIWTVWNRSKCHKGSISKFPIRLHYILWNKCNNWCHYFIFKNQSTLLKTAASRFIHSPFVLLIVILFFISSFDSIQEKGNQEFFYSGYVVAYSLALFKSSIFNFCNGRPKLDSLASNFVIIIECSLSSDCWNLLQIVAHVLVFLSSYLDECLHSCLPYFDILAI